MESHSEMTPDEVVRQLDEFIIAQHEAKRAVAIALRNRWRRLRVDEPMRDEITPKNIIMIGPTGVGKTEISRRLAKLVNAPFVKVEASKFTEVGYVGRDVESIIRDLTEVAYHLVREEEFHRVRSKAEAHAEEGLLDLLLPSSGGGSSEEEEERESRQTTREKLRTLLREGKLDERMVEVETQKQVTAHFEVVGHPGMAEMEGQLKDLFSNVLPKQKDRRRVPVKQAREFLVREAQEELIDQETVGQKALLFRIGQGVSEGGTA